MCGGDGLTVPVSSPRGKDTTPLATPVPGPDSHSPPSPPIVVAKRGKTLQQTQVPVSARASIVFPLLTGSGLFGQTREANNISKLGAEEFSFNFPHIVINIKLTF